MSRTDESREQCALFAWAERARTTRPELGLLFAVPNGGARHKATASRLKAEGVRAGVPDVCLPVPKNGLGALYIELKRPGVPGTPRGALRPAQREWIAALQLAGNAAMVAYGWDEARMMIEAYLGGKIAA